MILSCCYQFGDVLYIEYNILKTVKILKMENYPGNGRALAKKKKKSNEVM